MKIQLLLTGNELMAGHTIDSNSAMIAEHLSEANYQIARKVTIGDQPEELVNELELLSSNSDVLIVNGGLGPTVDDLTAEALSQVTGHPLQQNDIAMDHLNQWCARRKSPLSDANLKQALLPAGVVIIPNPSGSAVGFAIDHNQCLIICTPGVPSELKKMLQQSIINMLKGRFPQQHVASTIRFQTFGLGESNLQQLISDKLNNWPNEVELGFRAGLPLLEVKLTVRQAGHAALQQQSYQHLRRLMGDYIVGENSSGLAHSVIQLLSQHSQTVTTAESCTGGLIAASITEVAGASAVFEAGFVTYSNNIKQTVLEVDEQVLSRHGAVSEEVVLAMAKGAICKSKADYAIAVSGIAGPEGGSKEKPIGTVWIAWGHKDRLKSQLFHFNAGRKWFQQMVSATALDLLRRELSGITEEPQYFRHRAIKS